MIYLFDRKRGRIIKEEVSLERAIRFLYDSSFFSRTIGRLLLYTIAKRPFFSAFLGWWQRRKWSAKKIGPFIRHYKIDSHEFAKPVEKFTSFNDFFIRKLKPECRPLAQARVIIPADGRYRVFPHVSNNFCFDLKGGIINIQTLLQNDREAEGFENGASLVIGRLSPVDCHRFYFPCAGKAGRPRLIRGDLYSVNPLAVNGKSWIYSKNKRIVTMLETEATGHVAMVEVGATNVGSICQTFTPNTFVPKGTEKGYFALGGSAILLLFEPNTITFDRDFFSSALEMRCLFGQALSD
jgi:phosphatidylserine decarboxylase